MRSSSRVKRKPVRYGNEPERTSAASTQTINDAAETGASAASTQTANDAAATGASATATKSKTAAKRKKTQAGGSVNKKAKVGTTKLRQPYPREKRLAGTGYEGSLVADALDIHNALIKYFPFADTEFCQMLQKVDKQPMYRKLQNYAYFVSKVCYGIDIGERKDETKFAVVSDITSQRIFESILRPKRTTNVNGADDNIMVLLGHNEIPQRLHAYRFKTYWQEVASAYKGHLGMPQRTNDELSYPTFLEYFHLYHNARSWFAKRFYMGEAEFDLTDPIEVQRLTKHVENGDTILFELMKGSSLNEFKKVPNKSMVKLHDFFRRRRKEKASYVESVAHTIKIGPEDFSDVDEVKKLWNACSKYESNHETTILFGRKKKIIIHNTNGLGSMKDDSFGSSHRRILSILEEIVVGSFLTNDGRVELLSADGLVVSLLSWCRNCPFMAHYTPRIKYDAVSTTIILTFNESTEGNRGDLQLENVSLWPHMVPLLVWMRMLEVEPILDDLKMGWLQKCDLLQGYTKAFVENMGVYKTQLLDAIPFGLAAVQASGTTRNPLVICGYEFMQNFTSSFGERVRKVQNMRHDDPSNEVNGSMVQRGSEAQGRIQNFQLDTNARCFSDVAIIHTPGFATADSYNDFRSTIEKYGNTLSNPPIECVVQQHNPSANLACVRVILTLNTKLYTRFIPTVILAFQTTEEKQMKAYFNASFFKILPHFFRGIAHRKLYIPCATCVLANIAAHQDTLTKHNIAIAPVTPIDSNDRTDSAVKFLSQDLISILPHCTGRDVNQALGSQVPDKSINWLVLTMGNGAAAPQAVQTQKPSGTATPSTASKKKPPQGSEKSGKKKRPQAAKPTSSSSKKVTIDLTDCAIKEEDPKETLYPALLKQIRAEGLKIQLCYEDKVFEARFGQNARLFPLYKVGTPLRSKHSTATAGHVVGYLYAGQDSGRSQHFYKVENTKGQSLIAEDDALLPSNTDLDKVILHDLHD